MSTTPILPRRSIPLKSSQLRSGDFVDEHHPNLAAQIDTLEIVPAALGRCDAVSDEDQRGAIDGHAARWKKRGSQRNVFALAQRPDLVAEPEARRHRAFDV